MEIREKVSINLGSPKVKPYPPKTGLRTQSGLGSDQTGARKSSPLIIDSSFTLDDPGVMQEILDDLGLTALDEETTGYTQFAPAGDSVEQEGPVGLGPAVDDEESAACVSYFLQASDAIEADKIVASVVRQTQPKLTSDRLSQNTGYFNDEQATAEALERLGPGVSDETLSGYYAYFID